jgi:hypothetical protein
MIEHPEQDGALSLDRPFGSLLESAMFEIL